MLVYNQDGSVEWSDISYKIKPKQVEQTGGDIKNIVVPDAKPIESQNNAISAIQKPNFKKVQRKNIKIIF